MRAEFTQLVRRARGSGSGAVLARGASGSFILNVGWAGLGFLSQVLLARLMGKDNYGNYAYVFSWVMVLSLMAPLGFDKTMLRYLSIYYAKENWSAYRGLLRRSHLAAVVAGAVFAGALAFGAWVFRTPSNVDLTHTFWYAAVALPVIAIAMLHQSALQALKRPVEAQFGLMILRPVTLMLVVWLWARSHGNLLTGSQGMTAYLAASVLVFVFNAGLYRMRIPRGALSAFCEYHTREWLHMAMPMLLLASMHIILRQTGVLVLGTRLSTTDAGVYAATSRLVDLVAFGLLAVNMIAAPMFAELHATGKKRELQRILTLSAWGIFALCLPVALFLLLWGRLMLGLYGQEFVSAYPVLVVLLIGQVFNTLSGSVGYLLSMTGHQRHAAVVVCGATLFNGTLCWLLAPRYGIVGVAWGTTVATIAWNSIMLLLVRRHLGLNPTVFRLSLR